MPRPKSERNIRAAEYMRQNPEATDCEVMLKFGFHSIRQVYSVRVREGLHLPKPRDCKRPSAQLPVFTSMPDFLQMELGELKEKVKRAQQRISEIEEGMEATRNHERRLKRETELRRKQIWWELEDDEHVALHIGDEVHVMHFQGAYNFVNDKHCAPFREFLMKNFPIGGQQK